MNGVLFLHSLNHVLLHVTVLFLYCLGDLRRPSTFNQASIKDFCESGLALQSVKLLEYRKSIKFYVY